jgi:hypothetical protein
MIWAVMFAVGLVYISRYALTIPFVDEWEFIPVLFGERPAGPWLWELHNEHRFPLPRVFYLGLFWLSGDLRTGCYVSFIGISLCAAGLMRLARSVRGRASITDAVFPLLLMHTGQDENLYMGYQMCFMLVTVLAATLLAVIIRSSKGEGRSHFGMGLVATVLACLLLTCGAAGLCYGVAATGFVLLLAIVGPMKMWQRCILTALAAITPVYIVLYFQGYHRPSHHPESAGVFESARVGLEAQAMALGPAATGIWPIIGIGILITGIWVVALLTKKTIDNRRDLASLGLLLFVGAGAAVAFGIGWGRSGFHDDMGFAWRYGWLTFPPIAASYFTWLLRGGRVSRYGPVVLLLIAAVFAAVNSASGFRDAETKLRPFEMAWEADVRAGMTADQVVDRNFPELPAPRRRLMADDLRQMRDHRYAYFESLGREEP